MPPVLLSVICSFYVDMRATIHVKGHHSDSLQLEIGFDRGVL